MTDPTTAKTAKTPRPRKTATPTTPPTPAVTFELTANRVTQGGYQVADLPGKKGKTTPVYFSKEHVEKALDPTTGVATFVIRLTPLA